MRKYEVCRTVTQSDRVQRKVRELTWFDAAFSVWDIICRIFHELELQIRCKSVKWKFRLPWNGYCPLTSYNRSGTWDVAARRGNRLQAMSHRTYVIGRVKPGGLVACRAYQPGNQWRWRSGRLTADSSLCPDSERWGKWRDSSCQLIVDENVRSKKTRLTDAMLSFKLAIGQSLYKTYTYITKNLMYFRM